MATALFSQSLFLAIPVASLSRQTTCLARDVRARAGTCVRLTDVVDIANVGVQIARTPTRRVHARKMARTGPAFRGHKVILGVAHNGRFANVSVVLDSLGLSPRLGAMAWDLKQEHW